MDHKKPIFEVAEGFADAECAEGSYADGRVEYLQENLSIVPPRAFVHPTDRCFVGRLLAKPEPTGAGKMQRNQKSQRHEKPPPAPARGAHEPAANPVQRSHEKKHQ
jgi:hypothetical protein